MTMTDTALAASNPPLNAPPIPGVATLRLRDVASWQLPALAPADPSGQPCPPVVLAGLPSLQRGAVWRPNQVELLWDSVLRGFPIGALVACRRPPTAQQHTRTGAVAAHADGHLPWAEDQYTHHLLDGQQRANAVALGYLDPFVARDGQAQAKTILWIDLDPSHPKDRFPAASTRHHLLRVTTEAHPWGFRVSDDKEPERLSSGEAYDAIAAFRRVHPPATDGVGDPSASAPEAAYASRQRPHPAEGWPIVANAPLPLAWALLEAEKLAQQDGVAVDMAAWTRALWTAVLARVNAVQAAGRATGGGVDAAESTAQPGSDAPAPWWTRAAQRLTEWTADTASEHQRLQGLRLAQALRRAVDAPLLVLTVPQDALDVPSRLEAESGADPNAHDNVANLEHLFARLNNGGTALSADDLAYSMVKAYWPGIEQTIAGIPKRPPETQVALLGARLARASAVWRGLGKPAPSLPAAPNVSAIRQLGAVQDPAVPDASPDTAQADHVREQQRERQAWRSQVQTLFGLPASGGVPLPAAQTPIAQAVARVDAWFGYSPQQPWGLPPVLLARMATHSSEVYLFLLWLVHHHGAAPIPHEDIRRPLLGLATALHWFGLHPERAVRELWTTAPAQWLNGQAFAAKKWLTVLNALQNPRGQADPAVPFIPRPDQLAEYIDERTLTNSESIKDWRWWNTLVVGPAEQAWKKNNPGKEPSAKDLQEASNQRWAQWSGVIGTLNARGYGGTNALLLMYAQRAQMHHFFGDVDTRDTGFWDKHNVPWDFDHLLPQSLLTYRWMGDFQEVCQAWGLTIANLHLLPFGLNRARGDKPLLDALQDWQWTTQAHAERALLWEQTGGQQDAFSMKAPDKGESSEVAIERVHRFTTAARARLLRIYGDWFETLRVDRLL